MPQRGQVRLNPSKNWRRMCGILSLTSSRYRVFPGIRRRRLAAGGLLYTMRLQPVLPFKINGGWNLITRSMFTVVSVPDSIRSSGRTGGTGDSEIQFYLSPDKASPFIWGVGPVLGIPTASDSLLRTGKWKLGPGFAIIRQTEHWTYGVLANQSWSFAGDKNRASVSVALIHLSLSYTWVSGWTIGLDSETTYDSKSSSGEWTVPVQLSVSKIASLGSLPIDLSFAVVPYAIAPSGSPSVGLNFTITPLFARTTE